MLWPGIERLSSKGAGHSWSRCTLRAARVTAQVCNRPPNSCNPVASRRYYRRPLAREDFARSSSRPQLRLEQRREKIEVVSPNKNPDALLRWVTLVRGLTLCI